MYVSLLAPTFHRSVRNSDVVVTRYAANLSVTQRRAHATRDFCQLSQLTNFHQLSKRVTGWREGGGLGGWGTGGGGGKGVGWEDGRTVDITWKYITTFTIQILAKLLSVIFLMLGSLAE